MAPSPLPKFVYKIVPSAPPSPIPDEYPLSDLDKADGFVHLSTADQVSLARPLPTFSLVSKCIQCSHETWT